MYGAFCMCSVRVYAHIVCTVGAVPRENCTEEQILDFALRRQSWKLMSLGLNLASIWFCDFKLFLIPYQYLRIWRFCLNIWNIGFFKKIKVTVGNSLRGWQVELNRGCFFKQSSLYVIVVLLYEFLLHIWSRYILSLWFCSTCLPIKKKTIWMPGLFCSCINEGQFRRQTGTEHSWQFQQVLQSKSGKVNWVQSLSVHN